jgi:predicted glycosyltransferase
MPVPRLLFYVNSQYGLGHFCRVANILSAMEVHHPNVVSKVLFAGVCTSPFERLQHTDTHRLPGLESRFSADGMTDTGVPCEQAKDIREVLDARRRAIQSSLKGCEFDVLILEYFPFGKQYLADEVRFILDLVRSGQSHPPMVCVSIRDYVTLGVFHDRVLTQEFLTSCCDYVLVHSDPAFARLEESYGDICDFATKIRYTNYVVGQVRPRPYRSPFNRQVIVSAGGGKDGASLFDLVLSGLEAVPPGCARLEVHLFCGPLMPPRERADIERHAYQLRSHTVVLRHPCEYQQELVEAGLSISMCGYNTVFELLSARVPRVCLVPRQRTEQLMRAELMERRRLAVKVTSATQIVAAIHALGEPTAVDVAGEPLPRMDGARTSADLLASVGAGNAI